MEVPVEVPVQKTEVKEEVKLPDEPEMSKIASAPVEAQQDLIANEPKSDRDSRVSMLKKIY